MELHLVVAPIELQLGGPPPSIELGGGALTIELSTPGTAITIAPDPAGIEINAADFNTEIALHHISLDFSGEGAQGPQGPASVFVQGAFPPINYPGLLFRTGETADPDDLVPYVTDGTETF